MQQNKNAIKGEAYSVLVNDLIMHSGRDLLDIGQPTLNTSDDCAYACVILVPV